MTDNFFLKQCWSKLVIALGVQHKQQEGNSLMIYGVKTMVHG
jgi:hypothetical protein